MDAGDEACNLGERGYSRAATVAYIASNYYKMGEDPPGPFSPVETDADIVVGWRGRPSADWRREHLNLERRSSGQPAAGLTSVPLVVATVIALLVFLLVLTVR